MKLGGLEKLMARLYLKISPSQLEKLCAIAVLPPATKESMTSTIKLLKTLRKRSKSVEEFISKLGTCISGLEDAHDLSTLLAAFRKAFPHLEELESDPVASLSGHKPSDPSRQQEMKQSFNNVLLRISDYLKTDELEVLVALSPTPEGRKESLDCGHKLFEEMQHRGCVAFYDTELLEDLFSVLKLTTAEGLLNEYKQKYPELAVVRMDNYPSFGSGVVFKSPPPVTQHTSRHSSGALSAPSQPTSLTPSHNASHPPGFSTPHEEVSPSPMNSASLTRVASHPLLSRPLDNSASPRMFNQPASGGGSINRSSSFSVDPIYPRPDSGPIKSAGSEASIYPRPVEEATPSAPPLVDIQPAAKGTQGAEKFVSKQLYKPAVSSADPNLFPLNSPPAPSERPSSPISEPPASIETTTSLSSYRANVKFPSPQERVNSGPIVGFNPSADDTLESFRANNNPFQPPKQRVNTGPLTDESFKAYNRFPAAKQIVNTGPLTGESFEAYNRFPAAKQIVNTGPLTGESFEANDQFPAAQQRVNTGPKSGGVVVGAIDREPKPIEQNSKTRAKPREESSNSSVPVSEVVALMNGQKTYRVLPHQPVVVMNCKEAGGEHLLSENVQVESYHSSDEDSSSNDDSEPEDEDNEYYSPPVEEEVQETTPALRRKRTREQDPQDEITAGQKRLRTSGVTTRSKSSSSLQSGLKSGLKWFGSKLGLVKQED